MFAEQAQAWPWLQTRLKKEVDFVDREIKVLEIEFRLSSKTQKKFEQGMKELIGWSRNVKAEDKFEKAAQELKDKGLI